MTAANDQRFNELVSTFVIAPYQRVTLNNRKVSSFTSGTQGAAVFYWQAPEGRAYIVSTQAPWLIRLIQQAVGAHIDGRFGDQTRRAIIADARARGVQFPDNEPVLAPLLAYAISRALFNGQGRVGLPGAVVYPDISRPVLASGNSTYLRMIDVATGREVALVPVTDPATGATARLPANASEPPPATPPVPAPAPAPQTRPQPNAAVEQSRPADTQLAPPDLDTIQFGRDTAPAAATNGRVFVSARMPNEPQLEIGPALSVQNPAWNVIEQSHSQWSNHVLAEGPTDGQSFNIEIRSRNGDRINSQLIPFTPQPGMQANIVISLNADGTVNHSDRWFSDLPADAAAARPASATPVEARPAPAPAPTTLDGAAQQPPAEIPESRVGGTGIVPGPVSPQPQPQQGWSTGAKVATILGVTAALGGVAWYGYKRNWY